MIDAFLQRLENRVTEMYGTEIPEPVSVHLNQEIAYLRAMPKNKLDVYLTVLDALSQCGYPFNSSTPYQPCLIAFLFGLVKTNPVSIVPPEMCLAYPLDINLEACAASEKYVVDALRKRFGEERVVLDALTENRLYILFDNNAIVKRTARENRHGLLFEVDEEQCDIAVTVILLRHPLLEAAYAAFEEISASTIVNEEVFENLTKKGCIGGFDGDAVLKTMQSLQPRDIVALARAAQIGIWHHTHSGSIFAFREDVFDALIERGMNPSDAARLARNLDQARQRRAEKEMGLLLRYVDQQLLDDCFRSDFRPSILSRIGAAYYALVLTRLRMENPNKYEDLSQTYYLT